MSLRGTAIRLLAVAALAVPQGCRYFSKGNADRVPVVTLGNSVLYRDELAAMIPDDASADDSAMMAETHIRNWVIQNLIIEKAKLNLSEEVLDVEKRLEEYRRSLIMFLYQEELVSQSLDTMVSDTMIAQYYRENKQNFELRENIMRVKMVKWPKKDRDTDKVRKWMRSTDESENQLLTDLCNQRALLMHLDGDNWVKVDEFLAKVPELKDYDAQYFRNRPSLSIETNDGILMVEVLEVKYGKSTAPLEFERDNIRDIILNKRKMLLIKQMEKDIFDEAVAKKKFQVIIK